MDFSHSFLVSAFIPELHKQKRFNFSMQIRLDDTYIDEACVLKIFEWNKKLVRHKDNKNSLPSCKFQYFTLIIIFTLKNLK